MKLVKTKTRPKPDNQLPIVFHRYVIYDANGNDVLLTDHVPMTVEYALKYVKTATWIEDRKYGIWYRIV